MANPVFFWSAISAGIVVGAGATAKIFQWLRVRVHNLLAFQRELASHVRALHEIAEAQLTENGGGSMLDKVNRTSALVPSIQKLLAEVAITQEDNHSAAEGHWKGLEEADNGLLNKIDAISTIVRLRGEVVEELLRTRPVEEQERMRELIERVAERLKASEQQ